MLAALLSAVIIGTWNGNWFPSGRAEHRAAPEVEAARTAAAARMLAAGLDAVDPLRTNDVILVLNEMRGPRAASNLVAGIGRKGLVLAAVSGYRRRDRFDYQQDAIATTLPIVQKGWSVWKKVRDRQEKPPRGYAYAQLVVEPSVTAKVYAVHLKSDYGATSSQAVADNGAKRLHAVEQLCRLDKDESHVVIAGDFNADPWDGRADAKRLFGLLADAGFVNSAAFLPPDARGTHPNSRFGNRSYDHVLTRGFADPTTTRIASAEGLSDHSALLTVAAPRSALGRRPGVRRRSPRAP